MNEQHATRFRRKEAVAFEHCRAWCRVVNDGLAQGRLPAENGPVHFGCGVYALQANGAIRYRITKLTHAQARHLSRSTTP